MMKTLFSSRYFKVLTYVALFAITFMATAAFANEGDNVFVTITERLTATFQNVRSVIFIVGGFGLVGLGFAAIFGKIKWTWLAALAAGLAIVALAGAVVDYVTGDEKNEYAGYAGNESALGSTLTGGWDAGGDAMGGGAE